MGTLQIKWYKEGGETKGSIVRDPRGRRKIVFVARDHRGRLPQDGEVTDATVVKDTKPEEPGKGALLVLPIFAPDPAALTEDEAKARLRQMIRDAGVVLGDRYIEAELPGWRGWLRASRLTKSPYDGPAPIMWRYEDEFNGRAFWFHEERNGYIAITRAIVQRQWKLFVVDIAQAIRDLGPPASVESSFATGQVIWRDARNHGLSAELDLSQAFAYDGRVENVRKDGYGVSGTIVMLGGAWRIEDALLGIGESCSDGRTIRRAAFADHPSYCLEKPEIRACVMRLLRQGLHTEAWHQQDILTRMLSPEARYSEAIWEKARRLRALVDDRFVPIRWCAAALEEIRRVQGGPASIAATPPRFNDPPDPEIYDVGALDDADVVIMTASNAERMRLVDAEIAALEAEIGRLPAKHADADLRTDMWVELEGMLERIQGFPAEIASGHPDEHEEIARWFTHTSLPRIREALTLIMEARGSIEQKLEIFCDVRRGVESRLEEVRERFSYLSS